MVWANRKSCNDGFATTTQNTRRVGIRTHGSRRGGLRPLSGESVSDGADFQHRGESPHYGFRKDFAENASFIQKNRRCPRGVYRQTWEESPGRTHRDCFLMTTSEASWMDSIPLAMRELVTQQRSDAVRRDQGEMHQTEEGRTWAHSISSSAGLGV